jgi:hypothetical protein
MTGGLQALKQCDEAVALGARVEHDQAPAASTTWNLDQHVVAVLRNIDSYQRQVA